MLKMSILPKGDSIEIRDVWCDNLENEFLLIREIVDDYPYVAMDTEFPGIVLRPIGSFKNSSDYHYQTLKANVDMLKLIQLGLTFSDEEGNLPTCGTDKYCVWQFNFREFSVVDDVFANDSIELLKQSGIDFEKNNEKGIDAVRFGELLMSSGIVLNDNVQWVTFHSGYDFGYLLKLLTRRSLPDTQVGFFNLIKTFFPTVYDIKHLMKFCNSLHGGLNKLAELLEVERIGICHQAGSDSLLTSCTFRKLKESFFSGSTEKYSGVLYGLGVEGQILAPHTHFCLFCGKGFKRDANLRMHMRGHGDEYKTPAALAKPMKESTTEPALIKRYSCPNVGCKRNKDHKKFQPLKTILCVKNHYKRTHCDKSYICSRCNSKRFSVIADLKTHEKHCGRDKWLCSCGTTFSRKDKLFGHVALFQGHTPALPLDETKGSASDGGESNEATTRVGSTGFNFSSTTSSGSGIQNVLDPRSSVDDPFNYFSPMNFDTSNFGGFHELPRPPFEAPESSLSFLLSGSSDYIQKTGGSLGSDALS